MARQAAQTLRQIARALLGKDVARLRSGRRTTVAPSIPPVAAAGPTVREAA